LAAEHPAVSIQLKSKIKCQEGAEQKPAAAPAAPLGKVDSVK